MTRRIITEENAHSGGKRKPPAIAVNESGARGVPVYVLDRPNPISASVVEGPVPDRERRSLTDYFPMPLRHGMTLGELAEMFNDAYGIGAKLTVVPMAWRRVIIAPPAGLRIETEGEQIGHVNGLSVITLGAMRFGHPSRITAQVRVGKGEVIDIEREVALGGPIHSKGVLILSGFLGGRFGRHHPSLAASLVFEQSYGPVEGDSASAAELFALLSALADLPLRQSLAVTGSIDQHGRIQAIGGVNEKIEGFFDICRARGLAAGQGVLIPGANVHHLMLRQEVVDAAAAGRFSILPIETVDQGMELLAGVRAGLPDVTETYPEGTINHRISSRLAAFARATLPPPVRKPDMGHRTLQQEDE